MRCAGISHWPCLNPCGLPSGRATGSSTLNAVVPQHTYTPTWIVQLLALTGVSIGRAASAASAMDAFDDGAWTQLSLGHATDTGGALVVHVPRLDASYATQLFVPRPLPLCYQTAQTHNQHSRSVSSTQIQRSGWDCGAGLTLHLHIGTLAANRTALSRWLRACRRGRRCIASACG